MLTKEMKENWVAALRSGDYEQGKVNLFFNNKYCCLGVLCQLNNVEVGIEKAVVENAYEWLVQQALTQDVVRTLWRMNDLYDKTFPEIADWIEENL